MKKGSKHTEETKRKIAQSMLDNDNAEKWTEEVLLDELPKMIKYAKEKKCHLIKQILVEWDLYPDWVSDMMDKFKKNKTVYRFFKKLRMICEINTYDEAGKGNFNHHMAKMNLATHYDWNTEKAKNEVKQQNTVSVDLSKMTTEQIKELYDITEQGDTKTGT